MSQGGGFLAGSQGGSGSPSGGSGGSGGKTTSLTPVTIAQLRNCEQSHPDAPFQLDGQDLGQFLIVARVLSVNKQATNIHYLVDDGTGQIDVRQWIDGGNDDEDDGSGIVQDAYVRILGTLKTFSNKRSVGALGMQLIQAPDFNILLHHELEVIYTHLAHTRGVPNAAGGAAPRAYGNDAGGHGGVQANGGGGNNNAYNDLPPGPRKIMAVFDRMGPADSLPADGVPLDQISHNAGMSTEAATEAIDYLVGEGFLFSASDETMFLPTN